MPDLDAIRERAEHLLNHWTEPAFCRPWAQDAALTSARCELHGRPAAQANQPRQRAARAKGLDDDRTRTNPQR